MTAPGEGERSGGGLKLDAWGAPFSAGAGYLARQGSEPRQSLARGFPVPYIARRVTGGANIKPTCPHGHRRGRPAEWVRFLRARRKKAKTLEYKKWSPTLYIPGFLRFLGHQIDLLP